MCTELKLVPPSAAFQQSYLDAMHELPEQAADASISWLGLTSRDVENDFTGYVKRLERLSARGENGLVPTVTLWGVMNGRYVGRISLRLSLNRRLSSLGGHAGYDVRPSERGKGYATGMLRRVIAMAPHYGLLRLLVTCDETNTPSRKTIEKSGGEAISSMPGGEGIPRKLRFWISTIPLSPPVRDAVEETLEYLRNGEARLHLERDPYWPKWNSPWWHMLALSEMGLGHRIPGPVMDLMVERIDRHYLHHFPLVESELPPGTDPVRHIMCHCALGTMMRLLRENDIDVAGRYPWLPQWLDRYQMQDGGFNCDEEAYTRQRPVSSLVSTLPMLEFMQTLHQYGDMNLERGLAAGYEYLLAHRFVRSARNGRLLDRSWLTPVFPRFFKYDLLRGLAHAAGFAHLTGRSGDLPLFNEVADTVTRWFVEGPGEEMRMHTHDGTFLPGSDGAWQRGPSTGFPLLKALSRPEEALRYLAPHWNRGQWILKSLKKTMGPD